MSIRRGQKLQRTAPLSEIKGNKKPHEINRGVFDGGRLGIRTPGTSRYNGFQDRRFRPLSQPSTGCGEGNSPIIWAWQA